MKTHRTRDHKLVNLYVLDKDPELLAQYLNDRHLLHSILELTCSISFFLRTREQIKFGYAKVKESESLQSWIGDSMINFAWTVRLVRALLKEYTFRFGKVHKCSTLIEKISSNLFPHILTRDRFQEAMEGKLVPYTFYSKVPKAISDLNKGVVESYRIFYKLGKRELAVWTKRGEPSWWIESPDYRYAQEKNDETEKLPNVVFIERSKPISPIDLERYVTEQIRQGNRVYNSRVTSRFNTLSQGDPVTYGTAVGRLQRLETGVRATPYWPDPFSPGTVRATTTFIPSTPLHHIELRVDLANSTVRFVPPDTDPDPL